MTHDEYVSEVLAVLNSHSCEVRKRFENVVANLPTETRSIQLHVFCDQDGEGFLSIRVSLDGPDLYVLNGKIKQYACLFDTIMGEEGFEPPLPMLDPGEIDFEATDTLVDAAARWLQVKLSQINLSSLRVPISILNPDGYGTLGEIKISAEPAASENGAKAPPLSLALRTSGEQKVD